MLPNQHPCLTIPECPFSALTTVPSDNQEHHPFHSAAPPFEYFPDCDFPRAERQGLVLAPPYRDPAGGWFNFRRIAHSRRRYGRPGTVEKGPEIAGKQGRNKPRLARDCRAFSSVPIV
jgi:hypothetical protein